METTTQKEITPAELAGTKTEQNLHTALSAESQAYLRYKWFEKKAKNDGYINVAKLFELTAGNEAEHAEIWFRYLGGWSGTEKNLDAAAGGEHFEWATMYAQFAEEARAENFPVIAALFEKVASIEKQHEENFAKARDEIRAGKAFSDDSANTKWICLNCGFVVTGKEPPAFCPVCAHPQGYFARKTPAAG